jgi:hypothetical protein
MVLWPIGKFSHDEGSTIVNISLKIETNRHKRRQMASFEGFTFDPAKGSVPLSPAARSKRIDMDLDDIVKEERAAKRKNRPAPANKPEARKGAGPVKSKKAGPAAPTGKAANDGGKKRSWNIDLPEAVLKTILQEANVNLPDGISLKLIARKKVPQ